MFVRERAEIDATRARGRQILVAKERVGTPRLREAIFDGVRDRNEFELEAFGCVDGEYADALFGID